MDSTQYVAPRGSVVHVSPSTYQDDDEDRSELAETSEEEENHCSLQHTHSWNLVNRADESAVRSARDDFAAHTPTHMPTAALVSDRSSSSTNRPRRRTVRACEGCRKKKIACNGKQPCAACSLRSRDCVYTSLTVTGRPSKGALKLLQHQIQELEKEVEMLRNQAPSQTQGYAANYAFSPGANISFGVPSEKSSEGDVSPELSNKEPLSGTSIRFGPDAFSQRRDSVTAGQVDDYLFLHTAFTQKLDLNEKEKIESGGPMPNEGLRRRMLMLHTSFRLDPNPEAVYMTATGSVSRSLRLARALAGKKFSQERTMDFGTGIGDVFAEGGDTQFEAFDPYEGVLPPAQVNLHWPSREREDQLCNVYFRLVHPTMPILSRETLTLQRSNAYRATFEKDPVWVSIMLGIFIAAARHISTERVHCHDWWKARMQLGTFSIAYSRSIGGLQNLLITSEASFDLFAPAHTAWLAIGVTLRSMQARGLHREKVVVESKYDAEWKDIVRCIWWTAQKLDIELCVALGYPPAALQFDVQPPKTSSKISPMPYFRAITKGLKVKAQATDIFANRNPLYRRRQMDEVNEWLKELKFFLPFQAKEKDDEKFFACAKLWLNAYGIVCATHRFGVTRSLGRIFTLDEKSPLGMRLKDDWAQHDKDLSDFEREELDACFKAPRTAVKDSTVVAEALLKRTTQDVCFIDTDVARCIYTTFAETCLMYFIDSFFGRADAIMLEYAETFCRTIRIPQAEVGSPLWHIDMMASSMLRHLKKRFSNKNVMLTTLYASQEQQSAAAAAAAQNSNTARACNQSAPVESHFGFISSGSGRTFAQSDRSNDPLPIPFQGVLSDNPIRTDGLPLRMPLSNEAYTPAKSNAYFQGTFASSSYIEGAHNTFSEMDESSLLPTNKISPDSKVWNDFLQGEMMMLDQKDALLSTSAGVDPLFFDSAMFATPSAMSAAPFVSSSAYQQNKVPSGDFSSGGWDFASQAAAGRDQTGNVGFTSERGLDVTQVPWIDPTTNTPRYSVPWLGPTVGDIVSPSMQHLAGHQQTSNSSDSSASPGSAMTQGVGTEQAAGVQGQYSRRCEHFEPPIIENDPTAAPVAGQLMGGQKFWGV